MGNVIHQALEDFAAEIHRRKLKWSELSDELRDAIADECLDKISADYGNTILQSSARNQYMIEHEGFLEEQSGHCRNSFETVNFNQRDLRFQSEADELTVWIS